MGSRTRDTEFLHEHAESGLRRLPYTGVGPLLGVVHDFCVVAHRADLLEETVVIFLRVNHRAVDPKPLGQGAQGNKNVPRSVWMCVFFRIKITHEAQSVPHVMLQQLCTILASVLPIGGSMIALTNVCSCLYAPLGKIFLPRVCGSQMKNRKTSANKHSTR